MKEYQIEHFCLNSMGVRPLIPRAVENLCTAHHLPCVRGFTAACSAGCRVCGCHTEPATERAICHVQPAAECAVVEALPLEDLCAPVTGTAQTHVVQVSAAI